MKINMTPIRKAWVLTVAPAVVGIVSFLIAIQSPIEFHPIAVIIAGISAILSTIGIFLLLGLSLTKGKTNES